MTASATEPATVYDALHDLYRQLGITGEETGGKVTVTGADPLTPSVHRIGEACAAALAALGTEAAALWRERGGDGQDVTVSVESAIHQLMAVFLTRASGVPVSELIEDPNLLGNSDFYRAGDGRSIYVLVSYPELRDIACEVLDCPPGRQRMADAIAHWDAFELEEAICSRGGTAVAVRTRQEWRAHPQGRLLDGRPLIHLEKVGESAPEPFPATGELSSALPLTGLRVLDNSHVIAGPIAARISAELGADVLHVSSPAHPDPNGMIIETGIGKRAAFCDLLDPAQAAAFRRVLTGADVYVSNYLNLDTKGFGPEALVEQRPGLVVLDYHGWGTTGPWSRRGGFDQLACAAIGFAAEEGSFDGPRLPPTYLLNDYLAAILGTAGAIEALRRRAREGGSWRVHIDLAKVCMWVQDLGLFPRADVAVLPAPDPSRAAGELATVHGPFGEVTYLPTRIAYSTLRPRLDRSAEPLGASPLAW
ncbi:MULTISPECIES: CoA transferase [Streptomyces]|uniref:CoA transferase n=1 Tax=Streptomyces TaxID=1883 RepID=UPI00160459E0|nr:CoA transferase [Streptomyces murinus]MBA9043448.1 crotonobetainyl-CoA:carnitine CoA-transferase CaiB-like acyl-CoA transferase [Streptomyces murinus]